MGRRIAQPRWPAPLEVVEVVPGLDVSGRFAPARARVAWAAAFAAAAFAVHAGVWAGPVPGPWDAMAWVLGALAASFALAAVHRLESNLPHLGADPVPGGGGVAVLLWALPALNVLTAPAHAWRTYQRTRPGHGSVLVLAWAASAFVVAAREAMLWMGDRSRDDALPPSDGSVELPRIALALLTLAVLAQLDSAQRRARAAQQASRPLRNGGSLSHVR